MAKTDETTTWKIGHGVVATAGPAKREFLKAIKPTVDPVTTIERAERARIRRAIAPALRRLKYQLWHQGATVKCICVSCADLRIISAATRAPRPARAKKGIRP